ncbi:MAG: long-chain fatty acid--CoA ligase [Erysipelotrichaceae bacterium]|nr:long-chain fatty acid--CoA ligase [Erysipelotrichaceae bacterium]
MLITKNYFEKYTDSETFSKLTIDKTVPLFLDKINEKFRDKVAVGSAVKNVTYNELIKDVKKTCSILSNEQIPLKSNVGVICNNNYDFVKTSLGVMAYGAVATLLPVQLDEKTIFGCCMKYQLTCLFYEGAIAEKIEFAKKMAPNVKFIEIAEYNVEEASFNYDIVDTDPACIVLTGGTTGKSKGAILSHKAIMTGTLNGTYGIKEVFGDVYYSIMPLTHVFGLIRNLLTSLYTGSTIYFCLDKRTMFKEIKEVKPTILIVVPALAEIFLNLTKQFGLGFLGGNLRTIICGGASVPPYLVEEFPKFGVTLLPGYGLTETANLVSGNPEGLNKPTSVGYLYPNQEIKIVDGELWLKGDNLLDSYYNEPEENKTAFVDGWFKTGDLVRIDDEGFLYITGRIKDIIVLSNGENVSPAYIEDKINSLDVIQDSLVTLEINEFGAEILQAEVILRAAVLGPLGITDVQSYVEGLINEVNKTLFDYEQISKVVIRTEDFKRSPSMKIIRPRKDM